MLEEEKLIGFLQVLSGVKSLFSLPIQEVEWLKFQQVD